jgi:hypothetical protein
MVSLMTKVAETALHEDEWIGEEAALIQQSICLKSLERVERRFIGG